MTSTKTFSKARVLFVTLIATLLMVPGSYAQVSYAPVTPVDAAEVVDSTGWLIGPVQGMINGSWAVILCESNGVVFALQVGKNEIKGSSSALYFESDDCTGDPLIRVGSEGIGYLAVVVGDSVFVEDRTAPPVRLSAHSVYRGGTCRQDFDTALYAPTLESPDLLSTLIAPFTIQKAPLPRAGGRRDDDSDDDSDD